MSGYWYPLLADKQNHFFKSGALFEQAYSIYKFDAKLRSLILSEISKIEVAVRTQIAYVMSHNYNGLWFTDSSLFKILQSTLRHFQKLMKNIQGAMRILLPHSRKNTRTTFPQVG